MGAAGDWSVGSRGLDDGGGGGLVGGWCWHGPVGAITAFGALATCSVSQVRNNVNPAPQIRNSRSGFPAVSHTITTLCWTHSGAGSLLWNDIWWTNRISKSQPMHWSTQKFNLSHERVRINYKLNPCSTLLPCTALHFRAQHRLFLKVHAETKYCLSSRQQDTLTTVQKQICACNNAQQKRGKFTNTKLCRENMNVNVQQK